MTVLTSWKWSQFFYTVFGLDVAGRLVDNALYVKLTEDQVRISLKRTIMYFPWLFILPLFLKVHTNSHSIVKWLFFFIIENIQIHHCIYLLLISPFEIGFAFSGIFSLRKCDFVTFSRNMILLKEVSIV